MLIVCSSKEAFLQQLQAVVTESTTKLRPHSIGELATEGETIATREPSPAALPPRPHRWTIPTLRLLASTQTLKLAFCEDVTHLRAFLAAFSHPAPSINDTTTESSSSPRPRVLALLNPIAVHRETTKFSAQGLNRTFSIAIGTAHASRSKLVVAECFTPPPADLFDEKPSLTREGGKNITAIADEGCSLWDEEVSILNVATKTFGAGERGWVGRTVKLRAIAGRWCVFEKTAQDTR